MLIGVDAGCLGIKDKRLKVGVYQMARNLLIELSKIDKENKYLLYSFYPIEKDIMSSFGKNMINIVVKPIRGWMKIWLPLRILRDKPNIFLALSQAVPFKIPFSPPLMTIGFIYDLAFEIFPELYDDPSRLSKISREVVKKSNSLIVFSDSTKRDVVDFYHSNPKKITVVYQGFSTDLKKGRSNKFSTDKYFLFVGALKKIKNVPLIIDSFSYFVQAYKSDYQLFIVGGDKWLDPEINKTLKKIPLEIQNKIKFLGFVDEKELSSLYKGATAFVSPSLYEGFGLTFLEAISLGCPVIASNRGSIPEVLKDCAVLVDPLNDKKIAKAMKEMTDPKIRTKYIEKGFERSKKISINKFAETVLNQYKG